MSDSINRVSALVFDATSADILSLSPKLVPISFVEMGSFSLIMGMTFNSSNLLMVFLRLRYLFLSEKSS